MDRYEESLALWRGKQIKTDAELAEAMNGHSISFGAPPLLSVNPARLIPFTLLLPLAPSSAKACTKRLYTDSVLKHAHL